MGFQRQHRGHRGLPPAMPTPIRMRPGSTHRPETPRVHAQRGHRWCRHPRSERIRHQQGTQGRASTPKAIALGRRRSAATHRRFTAATRVDQARTGGRREPDRGESNHGAVKERPNTGTSLPPRLEPRLGANPKDIRCCDVPHDRTHGNPADLRSRAAQIVAHQFGRHSLLGTTLSLDGLRQSRPAIRAS